MPGLLRTPNRLESHHADRTFCVCPGVDVGVQSGAYRVGVRHHTRRRPLVSPPRTLRPVRTAPMTDRRGQARANPSAARPYAQRRHER